MADRQTRTNNAIMRTQEHWQEIEKNIDDHTRVLAQLSQIAERFQAVDSVFSDFKSFSKTMKLECDTLNKSIAQNRRALESIRDDLTSLRNTRSHIKQLRSLALTAIFLGLISLAFSVINFFQS